MSKKLFFEVPGIVFFVESCLRQAPLEIREWAKLAPLINSAKKGKFLTGQARILEMVKVIRARCTKVFVPVENNRFFGAWPKNTLIFYFFKEEYHV